MFDPHPCDLPGITLKSQSFLGISFQASKKPRTANNEGADSETAPATFRLPIMFLPWARL
jgi:hypothetical protein